MMKRRICLLTEFYDYSGLVKKLEQLALQGWRLKTVGKWFCSFERAQPQTLRYQVVYFPDISDLDPAPKEQLLDYIAMCEAAGWQFAAQREQMLIFCTEDLTAVPIDTDPLVQVETIHKVMKKTHIRGNLVMMAIAVVYVIAYLVDLRDSGVYFLANVFDLYLLGLWCLIFLAALVELVTYFLWLRRARAAGGRGEFIPAKNSALLRRSEVILAASGMLFLLLLAADGVALVPMVLLFVGIGIAEGAILLFGKFLKKQGYDSGSNQIIQYGVMVVVLFVFLMLWSTKTADYVTHRRHEQAAGYVLDDYGDRRYYNDHTLPLTLEQLGMTPGAAVYDRTMDVTASPLMSIAFGCERPVLWWEDEQEQMPALCYTLYTSKAAWLNGYLQDWAMERYVMFSSERAKPWQAEYVLKHKREENYLVVWEDRVLEISFSEAPTEYQIALVTEIMKEGDVP